MDDDDIVKGIIGFVVIAAILIFCGSLVAGCAGCFTAPIARVVEVASQELDPRVLLDRYNWFKDAAAMLDKKQADIKVYEARFERLEQEYKGQTRIQWAREDREMWSLWQSEVAGIKASYNTLAADYNSQMSKIQWRFCEIGTLPPGATHPLPREYKPYEEK